MSQVLVIDADIALRTTLGLLLEDAGYAVTATASPATALEHLRTSGDAMVVLFDAGVPRVSEGQVTALAMTDDPRLRRHAYICMTTSLALMHPDLHQVLSSLAVPIIEKPFEVDALLAMVGEAAGAAGGPPPHLPQ
jgi:CheY-like chemotaxis protein